MSSRTARRAVVLLLAFGASAVGPRARATEVKIFKAESQASFLSGTLQGISVEPVGGLRLADRFDRLTAVEEPFVFAAAALPAGEGWVVGTGNAGRVLRIDSQGKVSTLGTAEEPEIFAVWADPDGTVFAGSSPDGKVYRLAAGEAEVWFDPDETYIWALARAADGALLVATGTQGKLYRVEGKGRGRVLFDSQDTHLRSLLALPSGDVLVGTAGEGMVVRLRRDGTAQTLYDGDAPEVVALAVDPEGTTYAAALAAEASFPDLSGRGRKEAGDGEGGAAGATDAAGAGEATVSVTVEGEKPAGRPAGSTGPRSTVLRIAPRGVVDVLHTFQEETVYSLLWLGDRLWVGTGLDGKLYSHRSQLGSGGDAAVGRDPVLESDIDERQIVAVLPGRAGAGPAFVSTNAAALYRSSGGTQRLGTYVSPVLDAGQVARFGNLHWRGEQPPGAAARFSFRSGFSSEPDTTWSEWTPAREGREVPLAGVPGGRYLQWRVELAAGDGGGTPRLTGVEVSYRQENLRPRIESFTALDPGQILVPQSFNPGSQVFEPAHPDRDGMFTPLGTPSEGEDRRLKTLWKKGYRTLRWKAQDANDDSLRHELAFRPDSGPQAGTWLAMEKELVEEHFSFDSTALPDGHYRFRLRSSDRLSNLPEEALVAEQVSEAVLIDHTPPRLLAAERSGGTVRVRVEDGLSPLRVAEVSVDARKWEPVRVEDGLLDGRSESLVVSAPAAAEVVLLRLTDAAFNTTTVDLREAAQ